MNILSLRDCLLGLLKGLLHLLVQLVNYGVGQHLFFEPLGQIGHSLELWALHCQAVELEEKTELVEYNYITNCDAPSAEVGVLHQALVERLQTRHEVRKPLVVDLFRRRTSEEPGLSLHAEHLLTRDLHLRLVPPKDALDLVLQLLRQ